MIEVLIFGTGISRERITNNLKDEVKIIAFLDNDKSKWGKYIDNIKIKKPEEVTNIKFDYILIASQFNEEIYRQLIKFNINKNKIFQFYKFLDLNNNYVANTLEYIKKDEKIQSLITGISYAYLGINTSYLSTKSCNLAFPSQDLYYDYKLVKYIINDCKYKVKNVIITLSYYSFHYDLSKSAMKNKVVLYYEIFKDFHNFKDVVEIFKEKENQNFIAKKIFEANNEGKYEFDWNKKEGERRYNFEIEGEKQAKIDSNKDYKKTFLENTKILKEYINFLKNKNIVPILIVLPAEINYTNEFSTRLESEFKKTIEEFKKIYDFKFIDYFKDKRFKQEDFLDVSHLNKNGAIKFTKILDEDIKCLNKED